MGKASIGSDEWSSLALVAQDPASPTVGRIYGRLKSDRAKRVAISLLTKSSVKLPALGLPAESIGASADVDEAADSLLRWAEGNRRPRATRMMTRIHRQSAEGKKFSEPQKQMLKKIARAAVAARA
jgi:hypothetical protein